MTERPDPGESPEQPQGRRPWLRRSDFLIGLGATFLLGWAASWVGSKAGLAWLHYLGLGLVALPMIALMLWLSRVR